MINTELLVGYKRLNVWREAHELALLVYKITKTFPRDELFGLTSQFRRAVISVAANIVEGQARASRKEFLQFLNISNGSLVEVEYYCELGRDLNYIDQKTFILLNEKRVVVGNLLHGLIRSLKH